MASADQMGLAAGGTPLRLWARRGQRPPFYPRADANGPKRTHRVFEMGRPAGDALTFSPQLIVSLILQHCIYSRGIVV